MGIPGPVAIQLAGQEAGQVGCERLVRGDAALPLEEKIIGGGHAARVSRHVDRPPDPSIIWLMALEESRGGEGAQLPLLVPVDVRDEVVHIVEADLAAAAPVGAQQAAHQEAEPGVSALRV